MNSRAETGNASSKQWSGILRKTLGLAAGLCIIAGLNSGQNWLLRGVAVIAFLISVVVIAGSFVGSRRFRFVGRKLTNRSLKVRLAVEICFRAALLGGMLYLVPKLFYMCIDFRDLIERRHESRVQATVVQVISDGLTWWAQKGIDLKIENNGIQHYSLYLYPTRPVEGKQYELVLLPKSKCILSLEPIKE